MAHTQTPMANVEDDITSAPGPVGKIAEYLIERKRIGFRQAIAQIWPHPAKTRSNGS